MAGQTEQRAQRLLALSPTDQFLITR